MDQQAETIKSELKQLAQEARLLAEQVVSGEKIDTAAQQKAQMLETQLAQLAVRIPKLPADARPGLEWQRDVAERYLLAVLDSLKETELSLEQQVAKLSQDAFRLTREATAVGDFEPYRTDMEAVNQQLESLLPQLSTLPEPARAETIAAWNDGRMDAGHLLSGGELPMSMRLFYHLEAQKRAA
jgi:flagellar biosynthesis/type III secretory pathway chaperone